MSGDKQAPLTRRSVLTILGAAAGGTAAASTFLDERKGNITGGKMSLDKAYKRGEGLWIGPDSARNNVPANDGNIFIGASGDGYTLYHGDGGSWTKNGLGDNANPIPSVSTEEGPYSERYAAAFDGADMGEQIQAAIDDLPSEGGFVFVPSGVHTVSSTIVLEDSVQVHGHGPLATTLSLADGANTDMFEWSPSSTSGIENFAGLRDIKLDGNTANNTSGRGLLVTTADGGQPLDAQIENVWVNKFAGWGIEFAVTGLEHGHRIRNIWIENCAGGGLKGMGNQFHLVTAYIASNSGVAAILLRTSDAPTIMDTRVLSQGSGPGIHLDDVTNGYVQASVNKAAEEGILLDDTTAGTKHNEIHAHGVYGNDQDATGVSDIATTTSCFNNDIYVSRGNTGVDVSSGGDNWIHGSFALDGFREQGRNVVNGVGYQSGDPNSTGNWNGSGVEGVTVWDTSTSPWTPYQFINGAWRAL